MTQTEIWREIPSLPGVMASCQGRLKLLPYEASTPKNGTYIRGGKPRKGSWKKANRRYQTEIGGKSYVVARLIAEAFHGPSPFPGAVVMHVNENARDNRPENLRWGSQKENLNAPGYLHYCRSRVGASSPRRVGLVRRNANRHAEGHPHAS